MEVEEVKQVRSRKRNADGQPIVEYDNGVKVVASKDGDGIFSTAAYRDGVVVVGTEQPGCSWQAYQAAAQTAL